jgi:hypothetical protein
MHSAKAYNPFDVSYTINFTDRNTNKLEAAELLECVIQSCECCVPCLELCESCLVGTCVSEWTKVYVIPPWNIAGSFNDFVPRDLNVGQ